MTRLLSRFDFFRIGGVLELRQLAVTRNRLGLLLVVVALDFDTVRLFLATWQIRIALLVRDWIFQMLPLNRQRPQIIGLYKRVPFYDFNNLLL